MKASTMFAIALGAVITFSPAVQAQEKKGEGRGRPSPEERIKQLSEALKLTEEQQTKLAPIFKEEGEKMRAIIQEARGDREAAAKKIQEARKEIATKVKAVLTPEQGEKFDKLQAELASKRKQK